MTTQTTHGVRVSVTTEYQPEYSSPAQAHFVFTYKIRIENRGTHTVQLRRRRWFIHDAYQTATREVEGEGVVGQQPVLEPGDTHEYVSGCSLKSDVGKMHGTYQMERVADGRLFDVQIPEFLMITPYRNN
ncbi:MAG: Co2+/Mg2+ efflux protein ApaG [Catalinimonas sp.]